MGKTESFKALLALLLVLFSSSFLACTRFTPRSADLADVEESGESHYEGEEAFFSLDLKQKERLDQLVERRKRNREVRKSDVSYKVGVNDVIEIFVFETDELNRKIRVRPDGYVSLPLVGKIQAAGLTEEEVQRNITDKLKDYMHNPQVQVFIVEYAAHKVWVVGEIHKPGAISLTRDNYSLIELISEAGGRKENASGTVVLIPVEDEKNLRSKLSEPAVSEPIVPEPVISAGDPKAGSDDSKDTLVEALAEESGDAVVEEPVAMQAPDLKMVTENRNGIEIPFEDLIGTVDQPPLVVPLLAGDTVVIPEAGKIQIDGEVNIPGSYPVPSKLTLAGAIAASGGLTFAANSEYIEIIRELGGGRKAFISVDFEEVTSNKLQDVRLRDGDLIRVPSARFRFAVNQVFNVIGAVFGRVLSPVQAR